MPGRVADGGGRESAGRKRPRSSDDNARAGGRSKTSGKAGSGAQSGAAHKKRRIESGGSARGTGGATSARGRGRLDEEIEFDGPSDDDDGAEQSSSDENEGEAREESADSARLRLAQQYLSALSKATGGQGEGDGGADDDDDDDDSLITGKPSKFADDAIGARLAEDAASAAGGLFRPVGLALAMAAANDLTGADDEESEEAEDGAAAALKPARTSVFVFPAAAVAFKRGHEVRTD
jgi:hypothetical protein